MRASGPHAVPLALNPLTAEPELVGREIRNHLEQAGVRERRCVVGVPVNCALTLLTELPDLPEADVADFLALGPEIWSAPEGEMAALAGIVARL